MRSIAQMQGKPAMDQTFLKKWYDALQKSHKATAQLKSGERMCCLGVACDASGVGQWDESDTYFVPAENGKFNWTDRSGGQFIPQVTNTVFKDLIKCDVNGFELPHPDHNCDVMWANPRIIFPVAPLDWDLPNGVGLAGMNDWTGNYRADETYDEFSHKQIADIIKWYWEEIHD